MFFSPSVNGGDSLVFDPVVHHLHASRPAPHRPAVQVAWYSTGAGSPLATAVYRRRHVDTGCATTAQRLRALFFRAYLVVGADHQAEPSVEPEHAAGHTDVE